MNSFKNLFKFNVRSTTGSYGVPGEGNSLWIAVGSTVFFIILWYLVTTPLLMPPVVDDESITNDEEVVVEEVIEKVPLIPPLFLPGPNAVYDKFVILLTEEFNGGTLFDHIKWSMFRVFSAFLLSIVTAIPLGLLTGLNVYFKGAFDPPIEFYRPIPPLAYLPLMIIWFGIGELSKIVLIYLAIFSAMVINTRSGVRSAGLEQIHAAYSMGASKFQVITQVVLKAAMPEILTGMRVGIGFGWTTLVAAELVAAQAGIGAMIKGASDFLVTDVIIVGIVVIGVIAYAFDLIMRYLERIIVPWKGKMT
ncbi:taurine transport system permease protein [Spirochaetota bacterium]|nr:taurine transport system permease protein [Spirochaetota bacterium]